jgi:hypothetical protein
MENINFFYVTFGEVLFLTLQNPGSNKNISGVKQYNMKKE